MAEEGFISRSVGPRLTLQQLTGDPFRLRRFAEKGQRACASISRPDKQIETLCEMRLCKARIELQDWPRAARTSDEWPFSGQHGNASHRLPNAVDATAVLRNCNTCISDLPCAGLGTELQNQFVDL